jgi:hypothetical protein
MEILDHLTLARGCVNGEWEVSFSVVESIALICGAAERSEAGVLAGPAVITRLPFAVHLAAASWACGGVTSPSFLLRVSQMYSGLGRLSAGRSKWARSTTKLGLGGLDPATAEYVCCACLLLSPLCCLLRLGLVGIFEGGLSLFRFSIAFESDLRES